MERDLQVGVAAVEECCVAVVGRGPRVVASNCDVGPCAVESVVLVEADGIRNLCFELRCVGRVCGVPSGLDWWGGGAARCAATFKSSIHLKKLSGF